MHYPGQGNGRIYNLRLQLYISSGCASWFHGKPKASKDEHYIVLSPSLPLSLILNNSLSSHFLCNQNSGDSKLTYLLVSFLNTPEEACLPCFSAELDLNEPVQASCHPGPHGSSYPQFTWEDPVLKDGVMNCCQCVASGNVWLFSVWLFELASAGRSSELWRQCVFR